MRVWLAPYVCPVVSAPGGMICAMPTRDEPRLTIRLGTDLGGRLDGAALGTGVPKGTLVRRAIELGLEGAVEEVRAGRVDGSPAARGEVSPARGVDDPWDRAAVQAGAELVRAVPVRERFRLDEVVAPVVGDMVRARRAINAGLVRVGGRVVRDPMARVDPALVEVES